MHVRSHPAVAPRRKWLGLRRRPGRLALAVFRLPLILYRRGRGGWLGHTFLLLVHAGRKTGEPHEAVAMVLADDAASGEVVICSGWGPDVDWVRNLRAGPAQEVVVGRERFAPEHRFISDDEAVAVGLAFHRRHHLRLWLVSTILGWGALDSEESVRAFVEHHPFVAFRPAASVAA